MIRAHRRRSHTPESGSDVLIDIWPIAGPSGQKHIKHQPVVPENPKVPPRADEYQQWVRITRCLRRAGAASIADRAMGQPAVIAESVISALKNAGLNPRETPTQWFHILTQYPDHRWADLLPDYRLLTVEQALKTREQALRISPKTHDYPRAAGEPTQTYIPEYIPIAENATHILGRYSPLRIQKTWEEAPVYASSIGDRTRELARYSPGSLPNPGYSMVTSSSCDRIRTQN